MKIYTSAFKDKEIIPSRFTCDGEDINPEILIEDIPIGTKSLALIADDPDSPSGNWNHWVVWNIDPSIKIINENSIPKGAISGLNDFGKVGYGGPCPSKGEHRYFFKIFALDKFIDLSSDSKKSDIERSMKGSILEKSEFVGRYSRV